MSEENRSPRKKRPISNLSPVATVLQSLLQSGKSPLSEQFIRWRLWRNWEEVVGREIAKHSMPVGYVNGTLSIWVQSSARLQEMTFLVRPLRQKINDFVGKAWVNSIRFTLDRKTVPQLQESAEGVREFLSKEFPSEDEEPQSGL